MSKKCLGCGVTLQDKDIKALGYVKELTIDTCERCFRVKHYGDYTPVVKSNDEFMMILQKINNTRDLVLLVVDLFNIPKDLYVLNNYIENDQLLVITKRDLFSSDIYDKKFKDYFAGKYIDKMIVSSKNNYHLDELLAAIKRYKTTKNIYVIGYTNAGKSTLINKMIYNYSTSAYEITTSILPSTTLDLINVKLDDEITLIDTPGLLDAGDISNFLSPKQLKMILPTKPLRPITYQVKLTQYFMIEDLLIVEANSADLTFFIANNLSIKRVYKKPIIEHLAEQTIYARNVDVVITGLGFIKITGEDTLNIYTLDNVLIYTREHLI